MTSSSSPSRLGAEALSGVTGGIGEYNPGGGTGQQDKPLDVFLGWGDDKGDGTSGNDTIQGQGGNDSIWGGDGQDKLFGDDGNDWVQGGKGGDELHGGRGDDYVDGGTEGQADGASDRAFMGEGNDTYVWSKGSGNDEVHGNAGIDALLLKGISKEELFNGLRTDDGNLMLKNDGNGTWSFVYRDGSPAYDVAGTFSIGGETVRFYNMEQIRLG